MQSLEDIRENIRFEQVVRAFGLHPNGNNKILCPNHHETEPSFQVNEHYGYCFGCKEHWDNFSMAKLLLEKQDNKEYSFYEVLQWFDTTELPEPSNETYEEVKYEGPVPQVFIKYWHSCMVDYSYDVLRKERLLFPETVNRYQLGWRPDYNAWTIPFWRGEPGKSEVDVVQFRKVSGEPKYIGLKGHNRGAVMNAHLLEQEQPYLVIFFGSFDSILAAQDGLIAVGTNGSFPFKKDEKARVKEMFAKQKNIIIVPDNNPEEFKAAYKLQEWIGGKVTFFPMEVPHNTDYIDYRRAGHTAYEFKRDVLELLFPQEIVVNIIELLKVGDPQNLARYHAQASSRLYPPQRIVQAIKSQRPDEYSKEAWGEVMAPLQDVQDQDSFFSQMSKVSELAFNFSGGW